MSDPDYSGTSTEELIRRFIENAQLVGGGYDTRGKPHPKSSEAQAIKRELRAVATELRARKPHVALRRLYDHESPDVRSWASRLLKKSPRARREGWLVAVVEAALAGSRHLRVRRSRPTVHLDDPLLTFEGHDGAASSLGRRIRL